MLSAVMCIYIRFMSSECVVLYVSFLFRYIVKAKTSIMLMVNSVHYRAGFLNAQFCLKYTRNTHVN